MTLGGMLKHLAYVEDSWFSEVLLGRAPGPPWNTVDWDADHDWDWHSAAGDSPGQILALWQDAVARSRSRCQRRWPTAAWPGWPSGPGQTAGHRACAGSCAT